MPIDLIIQEKVHDDLYKAVGTFSNPSSSYKAEVLIQAKGNELSMVTSPEVPSKIAQVPIVHITPHEPMLIDNPIIGTRLKFGNVHVSLKHPL